MKIVIDIEPPKFKIGDSVRSTDEYACKGDVGQIEFVYLELMPSENETFISPVTSCARYSWRYYLNINQWIAYSEEQLEQAS